ncbi:hypothetical protein T484DRAFT_1853000, partial [Baffinella frigidus]
VNRLARERGAGWTGLRDKQGQGAGYASYLVVAMRLLARLSANLRLDAVQGFSQDLHGLYLNQDLQGLYIYQVGIRNFRFTFPQSQGGGGVLMQVFPALEAVTSAVIVRKVLATLYFEPLGVTFDDIRQMVQTPLEPHVPDMVLICLLADLKKLLPLGPHVPDMVLIFFLADLKELLPLEPHVPDMVLICLLADLKELLPLEPHVPDMVLICLLADLKELLVVTSAATGEVVYMTSGDAVVTSAATGEVVYMKEGDARLAAVVRYGFQDLRKKPTRLRSPRPRTAAQRLVITQKPPWLRSPRPRTAAQRLVITQASAHRPESAATTEGLDATLEGFDVTLVLERQLSQKYEHQVDGSELVVSLENEGLKEIPTHLLHRATARRIDSLALGSNEIALVDPCFGLMSNEIALVDPRLGLMEKLTSLSMSVNFISRLPDEIGMLTALTSCDVSDNTLPLLPASFILLTRSTRPTP